MTKKDFFRGNIKHGRAKRPDTERNRGFWISVLTGILTSAAVGIALTAAAAAILMATPDPVGITKPVSAGILFITSLVCAYVAVGRSGKPAAGIVAGAILALAFFSFAVVSSKVAAESLFVIAGMILFSLLGTLAGHRRNRAK